MFTAFGLSYHRCGKKYTLRHTCFDDFSNYETVDNTEGRAKMDEQLLLQISKQLEELTVLLAKQQKRPWGKPGRPTKEQEVLRYRENFSESGKMQCVRVTGMSIKTVSKYWDLYEKNKKRKA